MRALVFVIVFALLPVAARAADVTVQVRGTDGKPVAGAVVSVHLIGRPTPSPRPGPPRQITQQQIQFHPFVTVVPAGTAISFPNLDAVRHHVYSFSAAKRFELKLFAREQNRTVTFDQPGIVPLGCNIHDSMAAFIDVVDTPWAATTGTDGSVTLSRLPDGQVSVTVWHPWLRAPGNQLTRAVATGVREGFAVALRAPPRPVGTQPY